MEMTMVGAGGLDQTKFGGGMNMTSVGGGDRTSIKVDVTRGGERMDTSEVGLADMTGGSGLWDITRVGGSVSRRTDSTVVGGDMEVTRVGGRLDATKVGGDMDITRIGGRSDSTRFGGDMETTRVGGRMESTRVGGDMEMTRIGDNVEEEDDEDMEITNVRSVENTRMGGNMDLTRVADGSRSRSNKSTMESTRIGGNMDMTSVGGNMDMTKVGGNMDMTRIGGNMDMTKVGGNMEMTRIGGNMDLTRAGGNLNLTKSGGTMDMTKVGGHMEMTQVCGTGSDPDDVFANNSMMAELRAEARSQPSVAELPGSEPSSADTSVEFGGGATATVKFSVLSLANNTLVLPRKVSDEDDMTECPVQYFSYDPSKPVTNREAADANSGEEESPEVTPASSASTSMREASPPSETNPPQAQIPVNSGTSIGTVPSTESIGVPSSTDLVKESDESGWETMHSMIGLPPMTEPSMTPDVFPSKMQVSRRSLRSASIASPLNEDPSPEVTTCLGGLMMQRSRQFSEADLSTFEPGEESTRAFKLLQPPSFSGQSRLGRTTDKESPDVPAKTVTATGSDPSLNFGDVTTFSPAEESTRAVNKLFSLPSVKLRPQVPAERPISPLASASEAAPSAAEAEVDVTRPGSALSDAPPVQTMETLEAEMEVTGPPEAEAAPVITPTSSQPQPQWKTGVSRLLNEGEESPPKRMRMEEEEDVVNVHKENVPIVETFPRDVDISKLSVRSHLRDPNEEDGKISNEDEQNQLEMTKDAPNSSSVSTSISNREVSHRSLLASHEHSSNSIEKVPVSTDDMEEVVEEVQEIEHEISRSLHIKETHEMSCSKHNIKEVQHIQVEVHEEAKPSEISLSSVAATGVVMEDNLETIVETEVQNVIEEEIVVRDIEVSVFHDLATKQAAAGRRDWELVRSDGAMAAFGFMERSLLLLLLLGDQLQPKRSRKSAGRAVNHWTVRNIRLVSTHRGDGSWEETSDDAILDTGGNNCLIIYHLSS